MIAHDENHRLIDTKQNHERPILHVSRTRWIIDALWLLLLSLYIIAGVVIVPFHGDEAMQITMSRDFLTAFVDHQPRSLMVSPPYTVDSPEWLRLINGSVNPYTVGASLQLAGYTNRDLPPLWIWPLSYDENVARGNRPSQSMLVISRIPSALFLAVSAVILFAIGWQFRGRWGAYLVSILYILNPVVLLNGRRAMMEGSVLCFGLLTILAAVMIFQGRSGLRWWLGLGIAAGLTLASKHSGIVYVGAALAWVVIVPFGELFMSRNSLTTSLANFKDSLRSFGQKTVIPLLLSMIVMLGVFIILSPAQWNNPADRLRDLVAERARLLESQVQAEPHGPTAMSDRLQGIVEQPYIEAPLYFEASFWGGVHAVQLEIAAYDQSLWSGLHAGTILGGFLTLLAGIGIAVSLGRWRTWEIGIVLWFALVAVSLLVNPLPWQRYYLPLYPVAALLTALGCCQFTRWFAARSPNRIRQKS